MNEREEGKEGTKRARETGNKNSQGVSRRMEEYTLDTGDDGGVVGMG